MARIKFVKLTNSSLYIFLKGRSSDMRTFQYRLYPTKQQQEKLWQHANKLNSLLIIQKNKITHRTNRTKLIKHLVVATDGTKIKNNTHAKYFDKQIAGIQSKGSKLNKGSRQYRFLSRIIQGLYNVKVIKLNDFQHKVSNSLARQYNTIFAEDLSVKSMSEGNWTNLNKAIRNTKLAQFLSFLSYKANHLVLVNPKNTSKTCNNCGKIHTDLKLSDRIITCSCGKTYDRDENAANNVFCLRQAILDNPGYVGSMSIQEALAFRRE